MSCHTVKCVSCPAQMRACQMKKGMCPVCYANSLKNNKQ